MNRLCDILNPKQRCSAAYLLRPNKNVNKQKSYQEHKTKSKNNLRKTLKSSVFPAQQHRVLQPNAETSLKMHTLDDESGSFVLCWR